MKHVMKTEEILKVSGNSNPNAVAGAIASAIKENSFVELQSIGAGAVNQSVKAIAIASGYLAPAGFYIVCIPAFTDIELDGKTQTALKFIVQQR